MGESKMGHDEVAVVGGRGHGLTAAPYVVTVRGPSHGLTTRHNVAPLEGDRALAL